MSYAITKTPISDLYILEPKVYADKRGFFMESYNKQEFDAVIGGNVNFVQDNHSKSSHGVLRGLHHQLRRPQGKLVRVSKGSVFDVAVDLRSGSKSFGRWFGVELSEENKKLLWIPPGFAHGFLVLSDIAEFLYKTTEYYDPESEQTIAWNDGDINIDWPAVKFLNISEKDKKGIKLKNSGLKR